jgi:hypothetical protein
MQSSASDFSIRSALALVDFGLPFGETMKQNWSPGSGRIDEHACKLFGPRVKK